MADYMYDVAIIGAGPGGYVAGIRAGQLGLKACVIEKDKPGGVCLNVGCIPSKALIRQAELFHDGKAALEAAGASVDLSGWTYRPAWKKSRDAAAKLSRGVQFLLKKNGVDYIEGSARLSGAREVELEGGRKITAAAVIVATGSRPRELPGFEFDEDRVLSSTGALMLEEAPKSLAVLGAGAIGMELAFVMNAFGAKVTVVELLDRALPLEDEETAAVVAKEFKRSGIEILTGAKALGVDRSADGIKLRVQAKDGTESVVEAERLLVGVGRAPNTAGLGLEELGVRLERGYVRVGDYMETDVAGVYAIGDIAPSLQLAHVASKEGEIAAEHIAHVLKGSPLPKEKRVDPLLVPSAVYCEPQVGSFGLSEAKAKETGVRHAVARFPFRGIGKAVATEAPEGMVKLVYDPETTEILGASVVGAAATEVVHELLLAKGAELLAEDLADLVHAHPTISEGVMEAARAALGRAVHA
ncbi:MAG: dihydrolipoyl dehydrogenase [Spirochaetia bacterium]|nr:dihydrolipoyl dehydrogenase [Spirochaetia bacterium]